MADIFYINLKEKYRINTYSNIVFQKYFQTPVLQFTSISIIYFKNQAE